jgi:AcrR family transcriptional regulator
MALAQAMKTFWLKGFEATSMSDLKEAMGINSPSLYAAFGSKEALYAESVRYYVNTIGREAWSTFMSAATVREAVQSYLHITAAALTGSACDSPRGCMVTLSSVANEGYEELGELVRSERASFFNSMKQRLGDAVKAGELPESTDVHTLSRFVQAVLSGMSILARDGADRAELDAVVDVAMLGWDSFLGEHD